MFVLIGFLERWLTEMTVTNQRIVLKTGLLSQKSVELLLSQAERIGVHKSPVGRILGYGSVVIHGTGGTPERFNTVAHPLEFRRQVQQQIEQRRQKVELLPTSKLTVVSGF